MSPECTGYAAVWCPSCGDCTCPRDASDERQRGGDPRCPLHGEQSAHAAEPDATEDAIDGMAAELVALRALLREVEARLARDAVAFRQDETVQRLGFDAAKACAATCSGRATLVRMAREHVEAGRYDRAIALLQGDMPATPRPDIP